MANDIALTVPNLTTPGPAYASQVSADLTKIATHNHDGVSNGTTVDLSAQTCTADLSANHHNLSNVRSLELDSQPAQLTGSQDVNCLYVNQNNLGFNTSDGTFIPITQGDSLAPSALSVFLNWIMRNGGIPVSANASILYSDTYNLVALNSAGGSFTVTLPIAAAIVPLSTRVGRLYVFRDVNNACGTHPVTIQVSPGSGDTFGDDASISFVLNTNGAYVAIYTDGVSTWFTWSQNAYQGEQVGYNQSSLQLKNSTILNVDGTSEISVAGIYGQTGGIWVLLGSTNEIRGGTLALDGGVAAVWSGAATETHATGTSETFQSGASLTCAAGSTTSCAGTLNISGTTTVSGATTVSGTTSITGPTTIAVSGLSITGTGTSTVTLSKASTYSNVGSSVIGGNVAATAFPSAGGTFFCDAGAQLDNIVGCTIANLSAYAIVLPNPAAIGRTITVVTLNDAGSFSGYSVKVEGNANLILGTLSDYVFPPIVGVGGVAGVAFVFVGGAVGWTTINVYGF